MDKDDDFIISGSSDITLDVANQGAACETFIINDLTSDTIDLGGLTLDTMTGATVGGVLPNNHYYTIDTTGSSGSGYTLGTGTYSYDTSNYTFAPNSSYVNIDSDGVKIKEEGDLKIGDRSLKEFMDNVEERLAILRPAPELEEKWDQLKELRNQYESLKKDILEKEQIMKILKET